MTTKHFSKMYRNPNWKMYSAPEEEPKHISLTCGNVLGVKMVQTVNSPIGHTQLRWWKNISLQLTILWNIHENDFFLYFVVLMFWRKTNSISIGSSLVNCIEAYNFLLTWLVYFMAMQCPQKWHVEKFNSSFFHSKKIANSNF